MRRKAIFLLAILVLAMSATLLVVLVVASPQAGGFEIPWWTVDGGGGTSQGGAFILSGSIGQADAGSASAGGYTLNSGFWSLTQQQSRVYLPLVIK